MLGDIYKDSFYLTYTYYKNLGETHRMFCSERAEVVDMTDEAFRKLILFKPYNSVVENRDTLLLGGVSYVKYMESIKQIDESIYNELRVFENPFEFRVKLDACLESDMDDTKRRILYAGMFIQEDLNTLVECKSKELNHIRLTEEALINAGSESVKESLKKDLEDSKEKLILISNSFSFI